MCELCRWNDRFAANDTANDPGSGGVRDSVFVGSIASGEMYNQSPTECRISGTRRWVVPGAAERVQREFESYVRAFAQERRLSLELDYHVSAEAFRIEPESPIVVALQRAHEIVAGRRLELGQKPFVDDGNTIVSACGVPALTHGPAASGAHTSDEWVAIDELVRVARVYALTAYLFCKG